MTSGQRSRRENRKRRLRLLASKGLCDRCGKKKPVKNKKHCEDCLLKYRHAQKRYSDENKKRFKEVVVP